jgi:GTP cyclohydrolase I
VRGKNTQAKDTRSPQSTGLTPEQCRIANRYAGILTDLGVNKREGMKDTPERYAKFISSFLERPAFEPTTFEEADSNDMVIVGRIQFASLCEHHTLPFFGTACIAYIPQGKILGLSKLARIVHYFAADFQNQERLTRQVGKYIWEIEGLNPAGVGVVMRASHTCMEVRGVKSHGAMTRTQFLFGRMSHDPATRAEFLNAVEL